MKKLVVYDSQFGNTEKVAMAIGRGMAAETKIVSKVNNADLKDISLLVVGSPTQGGRATQAIQNFLENIPSGSLNKVKVAVFDTRFSEQRVNFALKMLLKTIDYASPKMARVLVSRGGRLVMEPEGFIVTGKEGPLLSGELDRAEKWGKEMLKVK